MPQARVWSQLTIDSLDRIWLHAGWLVNDYFFADLWRIGTQAGPNQLYWTFMGGTTPTVLFMMRQPQCTESLHFRTPRLSTVLSECLTSSTIPARARFALVYFAMFLSVHFALVGRNLL
jgi:hypothetical protein